jgi:ribosome-binding factor A
MAKRASSQMAGPSQRQLRVGEVLRRALADILSRGDHYIEELAGTSVTVAEVRPTPDLKLAHVYVMPLGGVNADEIVDALNKNKSEIRRSLNREVTLKFSPDLKFVIDTTFDAMDETRDLFSREDVRRDLDGEP